MRIEAYTQVQQLYNNTKAKQVQNLEKKSFSDELHISSIGKDIQIAKQAIANIPDIREDITTPIKKDICGGNYSVDEGLFAQKMMAKNNKTTLEF